MEKYPYMQDDNNMKLHPSTNYKTGKQLKLRKLNLETVFPKINTTHLPANQIHKKSTIHKKIKLIIVYKKYSPLNIYPTQYVDK